MAQWTQNFTLIDIFNDKKLKGKLPLINYKETELENGKVSKRTNAKTISKMVYDLSVSASRPYYNPLKPRKTGDTIFIEGNLVGDHNQVVEAIYSRLLSQRIVMVYTANNLDMIRSALKEGANNKRKYGIDTKLYLRVQSKQEIYGMSPRKMQYFINDIMENIFYSDNFPMTQKKFDVKNLMVSNQYNYEQRKEMWKRKVGI